MIARDHQAEKTRQRGVNDRTSSGWRGKGRKKWTGSREKPNARSWRNIKPIKVVKDVRVEGGQKKMTCKLSPQKGQEKKEGAGRSIT